MGRAADTLGSTPTAAAEGPAAEGPAATGSVAGKPMRGASCNGRGADGRGSGALVHPRPETVSSSRLRHFRT